MKKQNPIRDTVTHFVRSTGGQCNKKNSTQSKFMHFFEDLENRGPFTPNSLFETWTKQIRKDMEKAGTWKENPKGVSFEFVAEYIYRLQILFRDVNKKRPIRTSIYEYVEGE